MQEHPTAGIPATAIDGAFKALETYEFGSSRAQLMDLDAAVTAALLDSAARNALEGRLVAGLRRTSPLPAPAREYVCAQLAIIGGERAAEALGAWLGDKETGEASRAALEAIPSPAAVEVIRRKLDTIHAAFRAGLIGSLGVRRDVQSVPALAKLMRDNDLATAAAAAAALGRIGTVEAAEALMAAADRTTPIKREVSDASLACAETLLARGKKSEAVTIYKSLASASQPPQVQLAAKRGLLLALQRK